MEAWSSSISSSRFWFSVLRPRMWSAAFISCAALLTLMDPPSASPGTSAASCENPAVEFWKFWEF